MPFSLRLDPDTEATIRRLSATTGRSKSEVVREAVARYGAETGGSSAAGESAYDRLKPFIGTVSTGGAQSSKNTHTKYRALLQRKRRARRAR
jgi:predicted DNA-binding protein